MSEEKAALFDANRLDETCAGKATLKLRVIDRYIATVEAALTAIESAAASGDTAALSSAAHALKGSSLTIGSPLVSSLCETVEHSARDGRVEGVTVSEIRPAVQRLQTCLQELATEIQSAV